MSESTQQTADRIQDVAIRLGTALDAHAAIDALFDDTSVTAETTLLDLKGLHEDIDLKIECLESDLDRAAAEGGKD